jgi:hypothetical protein
MTCILDTKFTLSEDVLKRPFPFGHEKLCDYAPSTQTTLRDLPYSPKAWLAFLFTCDILETRHKQELCCRYAEYLAKAIYMDTDPWVAFAIEIKRRWLDGKCHTPELLSTASALRRFLRDIGTEARLNADLLTRREEAYWNGSCSSPPQEDKVFEVRRQACMLTRAHIAFVQVLQPNSSPWQVVWSVKRALEHPDRLPWLDLHQLTFQYLENTHD